MDRREIAGDGVALASMRGVSRVALILLASALLAAILPSAAVAAGGQGQCPNEGLRAELGWSGLPDCRGYEQVSPQAKGGDVESSSVSNAAADQSAAAGNRVTYFSTVAFAGAQSLGLGDESLATRGADGWTSQAISAPVLEHDHLFPVLADWWRGGSAELEGGIMETQTPLVEGAPQGYESLYVRDNATNSYRLVTTVKPPNVEPGAQAYRLNWAGASSDFAHVIFDANDALTPEAPSPSSAPWNVYESEGGTLRLVSILPDGSVAPGGAVAGGGNAPTATGEEVPGSVVGAMSGDGAHVFFTSPVPGHGIPQLYVRNNHAQTVEVSKSQRTPADPYGPRPAVFQMASPEGRYVLFTSKAELTADANTGSEDQGNDLYRYDVETEELKDLTVDTGSGDASGADVQQVAAMSDDGSYVYFVATGVLSTNKSDGAEAHAGEYNLYVWHEGASRPTFIGIVEDSQGVFYYGEGAERVTPDGRYFAFESNSPLTGYNNGGHSEVFLYEAETPRLACVSCNPAGGQATGEAYLARGLESNGHRQPRNLSEDGGRLFFESEEALVPGDTNGVTDVYEYERDGIGSCHQDGGCLYLISGGGSLEESRFVDASATGDDVFFVTRQQLVPQDGDELSDLYDARVGGGFAPPTAAQLCDREGCRPSSPPALVLGAPASALLAGSGNLAPPVAPSKAVKPTLTREQKLAAALKACKKKAKKKKRAACDAQAKKKYAARASTKKTNRKAR